MPTSDRPAPADAQVYDVLIIGAGPSGLATAARLREPRPSALFTDEESARFSWISSRASVKNRRNGRVKSKASQPCDPSILVLDESGDQWMTKWKTLFRKLEIEHLRSPMFFHPDPSDRDALLAFCHESGRVEEMVEITGCVGREISKHQKRKSRGKGQRECAKPAVEVNERDRRDYFTPSSECFQEFCHACVSRYRLTENLIRQEAVQEVVYAPHGAGCETEPVFRIRTHTSQYLSRAVVLAVGAGDPNIPPPFPSVLPRAASHVSDISVPNLFDKRLLSRIHSCKRTAVLVIGGGLTSAQTVDACIRKGVDKVWLLMRGHWKIKPFDVDLSWMSKFRNHQRAEFWNADSFEARLSLIQEARRGGSMTSRASKLLKQHILKGRLVVQTHTTISSQAFNETSQSWDITTSPPIPDLPSFDHVFFTTGTKSDVNSMRMLQHHMAAHPIPTLAGLPILNASLAWSDDVPLFFAGKMAMLQLGPGAGNLEGARESAERIAWAIEDLLRLRSTSGVVEEEGHGEEEQYAMGIGNKFARLSCHI